MEYSNDSTLNFRKEIKEFCCEKNILYFDHYEKPFVDSISEQKEVFEQLDQIRRKNDSEDESPNLSDYRKRFDLIKKLSGKIRDEDLHLINISDIVICHLPYGVPTFGTLEELFHAKSLNKSVFLYWDGHPEKFPMWLIWTLNSNEVFFSLSDILEELNKMNTSLEACTKRNFRIINE